MRTVLRLVALAVAVLATAWWAAAGASRGWTKTSVERITLDEITGLEGRTYEDKFVPGVDFLGAGLLGAAALGGASFLFRRAQKK